MKTKYILVGGYPNRAPDKGKAFCEEVIRGFNEPVRILDCMFARPEDTWAEELAYDKKFFKDHLPNKKIEIELAEPDKFLKQIKWANAIYLRGGKTSKLMQLLGANKRWEGELNGKTIAGTSAGANIIAKYYYGLDSLKIIEGLGLLPIKVIVHYRSDYNAPNIDWDKAYSDLKNYKEDLPIVTLAEGQFEIRES